MYIFEWAELRADDSLMDAFVLFVALCWRVLI
jgi:hypothetical protein